jgi:hypothetical protein
MSRLRIPNVNCQRALRILIIGGLLLMHHHAATAQQPFIVDFVNAGATGPVEQAGNGDLNNFSAGYEFTVGAADISVTELGYFSPIEELLEDHDVAIYDFNNASVPVVSATVTAGGTTDLVPSSGDGNFAPGGFRYVTLPSAVVLSAGATYRIAGYNDGTVEGFNFASQALITSTEVAFGTSVGDPGAAGLDYPNIQIPIGLPGCCIGPNFKYNTLPVRPIADGDKLWSVDIQGGPAGGGFGQFGDPEDKGGVEPIYGYGNVWNHFNVQGYDNATTESSPSMQLVDANGNPSSLVFSIDGDVQGWAGNNAWSGFLNQQIPAAGAAGPLSLVGDYLFLNAGQSAESVTWEIRGLTPGAEYEMYVYASVVGDDANRQLGFEIDQSNASAVIGEPGMLFEGIIASDSGAITGVAGLPLAGEQNWAGFQLRQIVSSAIPGDYNGNGQIDASDADLLATQMNSPTPDVAKYDENGDGAVNLSDRLIWVAEHANTWVGDANLNGEFNSGDLVIVFTAGKYETGQAAGWSDGDWDGNLTFGSGDLVVAFADGGFETGPRAASASAVPEPSGLSALAAIALLPFVRRKRA